MKKLTAIIALAVASIALSAQTPAYKDASLSPAQRADDLLTRLTIEQKVSLMMNQSPAIPELGIKKYGWWNEALHGSARNGIATVFPQSIGMAASWDYELLQEVFDIASTEQRIKYIENTKETNGAEQYHGLTVWTPNINIFRDPRWGRGQETYGEDPYLTFIMGRAVVNGLQGQPDEKGYDKLHACLKHYAVHSGPESTRHYADVTVSYRDLLETYLYAFENIVKTTDVQEIMGAYNSYDGKPCCGSDQLLQHFLREQWGYKGLVVSDCGAISDFYAKNYRSHNAFEDGASASANAVITGTDLECGGSYKYLVDAYKQGKITEEQIDKSLRRLLIARFRLGEMDPLESVSWNKIPTSKLACDEHRAKALDMARETMTLLQNDGVLPLAKNKKVAVIGPNADERAVMWGNYEGTPKHVISVLEGISDKIGSENVIYARGCEIIDGWDSYRKFPGIDGVNGEKSFNVNQIAGADVIVFVGGISASLEGEEMRVPFEGFKGGDRTNIELPDSQKRLLAKLAATGKPVIFVNMSGSAIAFGPVLGNCNAILQAWYGGEKGGQAIADVIFGDYNPGGRLPLTFYATSDQLGDFENYDMAGRTYRYFEGKPAFPFGFGLSYTTFDYGQAAIVKNGKPVKSFKMADKVQIVVPVTNSGSRDGDEVVQVYIKKDGENGGPVYSLRGFKRVGIKAGETASVAIDLDELNFRSFDATSGSMKTTKGTYTVYYGKSSAAKDLQSLSVKIK